ncbi:hypothetical protein ACQ4PT_033578 [Festuca glaucescens]
MLDGERRAPTLFFDVRVQVRRRRSAPLGGGGGDGAYAQAERRATSGLRNRSYVDGSVIWYDGCEVKNWTPSVAEDIVEDIVPPEPRRASRRVQAKQEAEQADEAKEATHGSEDDDSDYNESIILDSDYVITSGDDDLHDDELVGDKDLKGKRQQTNVKGNRQSSVEVNEETTDDSSHDEDYISEEDDFWEPNSEEEKVKLRFKQFTPEDMKKHVFSIGQVFKTVEHLRQAIREYSCQTRKAIRFEKNDQQRLFAKCKAGCPWYIWASPDSRSDGFQIKKHCSKHSCSKTWKINSFSSDFLVGKYVEQFREDEGMMAFAVVEVEDTETLRWFLQTLKQDLGIENTYPWIVMSDMQKGLIKAATELFPNSEHRFCVRHMWQNFQNTFRGDVLKNQLWKIARSSVVAKWEANMEEMKAINPEAYAWLEELPHNTWVRAFQSKLPKCDVLVNNISEVFNKYILEARELPVMSMIARIKHQLMTRHYNKDKEAKDMKGHENAAEGGQPSAPTYGHAILQQLMQQRQPPRVRTPMPLPESAFISAAQRLASQPGPSSSTIRQGKLAQKLEAMKQARSHDLENRRTVILEARYEAQLRRAEEAEMRKLEIQ